jgi:hypothetical protein
LQKYFKFHIRININVCKDINTNLNKYQNNSKMDLIVREIRWDGVDWIDMAQDRDKWRALVNMILNIQVP